MPRLMVPSSGGGTKLMRTLLVEDAEGVCSGTGEGAADSSGVGEEVGAGVGASCPIAAQIEAKAIRMTALNFFVMSIEWPPAPWLYANVGRHLLLLDPRKQKKRESLPFDFAQGKLSTSLGLTNRLYVIPPVYVREKVIAPFAIAQNCFIEMVRRELIMQSIETSKVILRPFRGVLLCGSCLHQERPIARLCQ